MSERPLHAPPWSLERTTGYLKRAGVDPDTGERVAMARCDVCDRMKPADDVQLARNSAGTETYACSDCRDGGR